MQITSNPNGRGNGGTLSSTQVSTPPPNGNGKRLPPDESAAPADKEKHVRFDESTDHPVRRTKAVKASPVMTGLYEMTRDGRKEEMEDKSSYGDITRRHPPPQQRRHGEPTENPAKIRLGKVNPLPHILTVVAIFAFLLWATFPYYSADNENQDAKGHVKPKKGSLKYLEQLADGLNEAQSALASVVEKSLQGRGRQFPCALFVGDSSIPFALGGGKSSRERVTSQSLFAGKNYSAGDLILPAPKYLVPLRLAVSDDDPEPALFLAPHAFLIKHHPTLANVKGKFVMGNGSADSDLGGFELRALVPIPAGSELFVSYEDHPHSFVFGTTTGQRLFGHIPTEADYQLADDIQSDTLAAVRVTQVENSRTGARTVVTGPLYPIMKRAISRVDPKIAALLPGTAREAAAYRGNTSALASLQGFHGDLGHLKRRATCLLDDVEIEHESGREVAARDIGRGETISLVHVHAMRNPMTCGSIEDCHDQRNTATKCTSPTLSQVILCPLLSPMGFFSSDRSTTAVDNGSNSKPNVEIRWTDKSVPQMSASEISDYSAAGSLSWSIVALEKIERGQEVWNPSDNSEFLGLTVRRQSDSCLVFPAGTETTTRGASDPRLLENTRPTSRD